MGHELAGEPLTRRTVLGLMAAAAAGPSPARAASSILTRPIPSSGEAIPVVGLGTWRTFDVGPAPAERAPLKTVLQRFVELGGRVIDSSPMYGTAESVAGDLAAELAVTDKLFFATKVWTSGREAGVRADRAVVPPVPDQAPGPAADPQPARLEDPAAHAPGFQADGPHPLRGRHPLHGERVRRAGARAPQRAARFPPGELLGRRARGRASHPAAGRRARHRGAGEPTVLRGGLVPARPRQGAAGVGEPRSAARAGLSSC